MTMIIESMRYLGSMLGLGTTLIWQGLLESLNAKDYTPRHKGDK